MIRPAAVDCQCSPPYSSHDTFASPTTDQREWRPLFEMFLLLAGGAASRDGVTMTRLRKLLRDDQGQDLIEYALLVGFLAWVSVEWVLLKWS